MSRTFPCWFFGFALVAGSALAAERSLEIDRTHSRIDVDVHATGDSFTGSLKQFEPMVVVTDDGRVTAARLAFKFRDVVTGKTKRDQAMHEWQHTAEHPDAVFVLTSLESGPAPAGGQLALGRLTFHGITREIRFPVSLLREGERTVIDGAAPIDTREYGLPIIRMFGFLKVDPIVKVRFHLEGRTSPERA